MIQARKRFGQNFLHDRHIIHRIIEAIQPEVRTHVVEIGPGRGALTFPLLERAKHFTAIEIDRDLIAFLQQNTPKPFEIIEGNALHFDFLSLCPAYATESRHDKLTVVGNLPYNISTPILFHLLSQRAGIDEMFFMLQKEVVLRMAADSGTKEYGRLSVMTQYFCEVEPLFLVHPGAFTPAPKVDSMIVRLKPYRHSPYGAVKDFAQFEKIVRLAFNQRRKTLRNALKSEGLLLPAALAGERPETLTINDFVTVAGL